MITFNDLLTEPKYREMTIKQLSDIVSEMDFTNEEYEKGSEFFNKINPESTKPLSANLYYYFEKLKAESEKKAELKLGRKSLPDEIDMSKYIKQAPIQITDQKAREICAKYFNCPPNEIKIV